MISGPENIDTFLIQNFCSENKAFETVVWGMFSSVRSVYTKIVCYSGNTLANYNA